MEKEIVDLVEDRLLEERDNEFSMGIRNGPALKAYNEYILEKKRKETSNP